MPDYVFLMHNDMTSPEDVDAWGPYLARLRASGAFEGGSAIGAGATFRKSGVAAEPSPVTGFIRVTAPSLHAARDLLAGNPVYDAGGTVEIRELTEE